MSHLQHVAVATPSSALGLLCLGTFPGTCTSAGIHLWWVMSFVTAGASQGAA